MTHPKTEIICPTCHKKIIWDTSNPDRPFCSKRCKLIDLGAWADEQYKVPGTEQDQLSQDDEENDH